MSQIKGLLSTSVCLSVLNYLDYSGGLVVNDIISVHHWGSPSLPLLSSFPTLPLAKTCHLKTEGDWKINRATRSAIDYDKT